MTKTNNLLDDERGAIVVMGVFMACFLVGTLWYVMGVGDAAIYAEQLSQAADATAYAGAVYHARGMNVIAMLNIIMAATVTILVGSKVIAELLRSMQMEATAICNKPPATDAQGNVTDPKPGAWACPVAQEAHNYLVMMNELIGIIDDYGDGMVVGLARGQAEVAAEVPWIAQTKLTQGGATAPAIHTGYQQIGAPIESGDMVSASMNPPGVRLGLPVENEPFELMCMRGQTLVEEIVMVAILPLIQMLPDAEPFLRISKIGAFIGAFPPAYCSGNGSSYSVDVVLSDDLCNKELAERGVVAATEHPKPRNKHDYGICHHWPNLPFCGGSGNNSNNDDDDEDDNWGSGHGHGHGHGSGNDDDHGSGNGSSSSGAGGAGPMALFRGSGGASADFFFHGGLTRESSAATGGGGGAGGAGIGGASAHAQEECEEHTQEAMDNATPLPPVPGVDVNDPMLKQGKRIFGPARNGDDHFQVWGVITGRMNYLDRSSDGVWISALAGPAPAGDNSWAAGKIAQAEFYYDQTHQASNEDKCWKVVGNKVVVAPGQCHLTWDSYKDVVLWNMRWRARLRRLQETSGSTGGAAISKVLSFVSSVHWVDPMMGPMHHTMVQ